MKLFKVADLIQKNLKITPKIVKNSWKFTEKSWNVVSPEKCGPCRKSQQLAHFE